MEVVNYKLEVVLMDTFSNSQYSGLISDLLNDTQYIKISNRGKLAGLRNHAEVLVRKILNLGNNQKLMLGQIRIDSDNRAVVKSLNNLGEELSEELIRIINNIKMGYLDTMRSFNKLQGHIYYFKPEEFAKMLEIFNLQTIYGLEYAAQMYKMYKYREYIFEEFIAELQERHQDAEKQYQKIKNSNLIQIGKKLNTLFDKGLGICIAKDLYLDRPASKVSKYLLNFLKDYVVAAKALIELKNYME